MGNARTALIAWLQARSLGGALIMRMEDLDTPRVVPGAAEQILSDLRWLGLDWDEGPDAGGAFGPYSQGARFARYQAAVEKLRASGRVFACTCTRAEVARASSAPHGAQDEGPRYPGTCRNGPSKPGQPASLRFRVPEGEVAFVDGLHGRTGIDVAATSGDFVVKRVDGLFAYQLAVAVDDGAMAITHVLRGDDLLTSTPRQILVLQALGERVPEYTHVPLVVGRDGGRLQKRAGDVTLSGLRQQGVAPERLCGYLAYLSGLADQDARLRPIDLVSGFAVKRLPRTPARFDPAEL